MGDWYIKTADSIVEHLAVKSDDGMYFIAERDYNGHLINKFEHLACFTGGMLALGAQHISDESVKRKHMEVAEGIGNFCWQMYNTTSTGLSPEHVLIDIRNDKFTIRGGSGSAQGWIMRPEAIETWFILWRVTKNQKYRDWGWWTFQAMNKYARSKYGYSGVYNSRQIPVSLDDVQQSYFLAETLKYLYLMFSPDDVIPLDKFVFNTEAHPLLIYK